MQTIILFIFYIITYVLLTAIIHHKLRRLLRRLLRQPTGGNAPPTYPIIGCLIAFYNNRHRLLPWYTDLVAESPTQTVVIRRFGARRTIITANPQNVEYMLKTNFINFPKGKPFTEILNDFLGLGIFNVDGELWHFQRKLASHQFTSRSMRDHVEMTVKEAVKSKLFPVLDSFADDQSPVDLQEVLRRLGFDIVCKLTLGFDPCSLRDRRTFSGEVPILKAFDTAAEICARRAATPIAAVWRLKKLVGIGSEKVLKDSVNEIHKYITEIIHQRKKKMINEHESNDQNHDLLSRLIVSDVSEDLIRDMVISFIIAGKDTTSAAMTWLFYSLCRNSDVAEQLVNEIDSKSSDNNNNNDNDNDEFDEYKESKYLQACIRESMRLYPPVSWDSKHAVADDVLPDGTRVRSGDRVTYFPYGMGRMESIWGVDRLEFRPERWLEGGGAGGAVVVREVSAYEYPVFQAGPRVCIGRGMAQVQMSCVVGSVVRWFEVGAVGCGEGVYVPSLTARMDGGFEVVVRRRGATWRDKGGEM